MTERYPPATAAGNGPTAARGPLWLWSRPHGDGGASLGRRVRVGELLDRYPIAEPFSAVGVGWFGTGDGLRVSIVDVFADGGAAERARETIDAMYRTDEPLAPGIGPLRDLFAVDAVVGDGRTVEVVLDPEPGVASGPVIESPLFGNQRYFLHR